MQTAREIAARQQLDTTPAGAVQDWREIADRLQREATTPEGRTFAESYARTAGQLARDTAAGARNAPDMTDGNPHPEAALADRGWEARDGVWVRDDGQADEPASEPAFT
jgi:hypothetical protein